jgi:hypothetical protein
MLCQPEEHIWICVPTICIALRKNITRRLQIEQASNKHLRQAHASKKINHHQHISTGLAGKFSEKQTIIDGLNQTTESGEGGRSGQTLKR